MNSQENFSIDVNIIIDRLKEEVGVANDGDLATLLGVKPSTLSMSRKRNSIDLIRVFNYFEGYSKDWILHGTLPKKLYKKREAVIQIEEDNSSMAERIDALDIDPLEKYKLLRTYIKTLDQLKSEK